MSKRIYSGLCGRVNNSGTKCEWFFGSYKVKYLLINDQISHRWCVLRLENHAGNSEVRFTLPYCVGHTHTRTHTDKTQTWTYRKISNKRGRLMIMFTTNFTKNSLINVSVIKNWISIKIISTRRFYSPILQTNLLLFHLLQSSCINFFVRASFVPPFWIVSQSPRVDALLCEFFSSP